MYTCISGGADDVDPLSLDHNDMSTPAGDAPAAPGDGASATPGGIAPAAPGDDTLATLDDGSSATSGDDAPAAPGNGAPGIPAILSRGPPEMVL